MLVEMSSSDLIYFCDHVLTKEWPYSILAINFLRICDKWRQHIQNFHVSLLYKENCIESGVFIGILRSGTLQPALCIYALDNYEDMLEKELLNVISDWNEPILFEGLLKKHLTIVQKLISRFSYVVTCVNDMSLRITSMENALKQSIELSPDIEIATIKSKFLPEMYENWLLKNIFTIEELQNSLYMHPEAAIGIYYKSTGELLCRVMKAHNGAICVLQTVEKARNKGYAKLIIKQLTKTIAMQGDLPYTFVNINNKSSLAVFETVGYKHVCLLTRIIIQH